MSTWQRMWIPSRSRPNGLSCERSRRRSRTESPHLSSCGRSLPRTPWGPRRRGPRHQVSGEPCSDSGRDKASARSTFPRLTAEGRRSLRQAVQGRTGRSTRRRQPDRPLLAVRRSKADVRGGADGRLLLGDSASDELLGTAEIRTPAFRRSARVRGIVRPVAATSVPAGGVLRVLPRDSERAVLVALAFAEALGA